MDSSPTPDTPLSTAQSQPAQDPPTPSTQDSVASPSSSAPNAGDVDPQILEALKSKDRLFVLKLGEQLEGLIKERRPRVDLAPATSYQRLLVHRVSAYYKLQPESDPSSKTSIAVLYTAEGRIPSRRVCELVPAESPTQPAFKIMRRSPNDRRNKPASQAGSIAGEDTEVSDVEPSDSASLGGRSSMTSSSAKKHLTIEQREAAYLEARSRIFMDFNEKDKGKDKDLSASSSSISLTSASASTSTGPRSSIGDTDDASSPATESEWSGPSGPNKKDSRRSYGQSSRNGQTSHNSQTFTPAKPSRNSRAASPSFTFPSLYDPAHNNLLYDPSQPHSSPATVGYTPNQYAHSYAPPSQGPSPPFMAPYPFYPPFHPYQSPSPHGPPVSEPPSAAASEAFSPPPVTYGPPYMWPHPGQPPMQSPQHAIPLPPGQQLHNQPMAPPHPPPHSPPYHPPYMHHQPGAYYPPPSNAFFPTPPGPPMPPPMHPPMSAPPPLQQQQQPQPRYDVPRPGMMPSHPPVPPPDQFNPHNQSGNRNGGVHIGPPHNGNNHGNNGRSPARPNHNSNSLNSKGRGGGGREHLNYVPGGGMGGHTATGLGTDTVGPRFNNRRTSHNSNSGNSRSSNGDDVSSSSSTTSSSSRRTYTSTTSSQQHPLPPRPDWAVGMIAQPSLAGRTHEPTLTPPQRNTIASPRNGNHGLPHTNNTHMNVNNGRPTFPPQTTHNGIQNNNMGNNNANSLNGSLQSTDFPPLNGTSSLINSPAPSVEKRTAPTGAWGAASRPILSLANGNVVGAVPAGGNGGGQNGSLPPPSGVISVGGFGNGSPRLDDQNSRTSGPANGSNKGEYQPKLMRRPAAGNILQPRAPNDVSGTAASAVAALARQTAAISLKDQTKTSEPMDNVTVQEADATVPAVIA